MWLGVCTARTLGSHSTPKTSAAASGIAHLLVDLRAWHKVRATSFDTLRMEYRKLGCVSQWTGYMLQRICGPLHPQVHTVTRSRPKDERVVLQICTFPLCVPCC